tara:strand:- start:2393 stop:2590 length:198 start_codon:yes stop_codon:yes gene_type:complete
MNLVKKLYKIAIIDLKNKKFIHEKHLKNKLKSIILLNKDLDKKNADKAINGLIFQIRNINNVKYR